MHAVVVTVRPPERSIEQARQMVEEQVIPRAKVNPGFVVGYWLAPSSSSGEGLSVTVFETEEQARAAAEAVSPPPPVELLNVEVREVLASA